MHLHLIKMYFHSPIIISKGINDYTRTHYIIYSDTIKSALFVHNLNAPHPIPSPSDFFNQFKVSSAFPFFDDILFFPKPLKKLNFKFTENNTECDEKKVRKKRKKIEWLHKELFISEIHNQAINIPLNQISPDGKFIFPNSSPPKNFIHEEIITKVRHHFIHDNEPFDITRYHFDKNAGLFVIIQSTDEFIYKHLIPAFQLLAEAGFGRYKNVGNGNFSIDEVKTLSINTPPNPNSLINLSLFCPTHDDWQFISQSIHNNPNSTIYYKLIQRGGYITSILPPSPLLNYRKKNIYMFHHASVFPYKPNHYSGKIIDITPQIMYKTNPNTTILRDGTSIFIPSN